MKLTLLSHWVNLKLINKCHSALGYHLDVWCFFFSFPVACNWIHSKWYTTEVHLWQIVFSKSGQNNIPTPPSRDRICVCSPWNRWALGASSTGGKGIMYLPKLMSVFWKNLGRGQRRDVWHCVLINWHLFLNVYWVPTHLQGWACGHNRKSDPSRRKKFSGQQGLNIR